MNDDVDIRNKRECIWWPNRIEMKKQLILLYCNNKMTGHRFSSKNCGIALYFNFAVGVGNSRRQPHLILNFKRVKGMGNRDWGGYSNFSMFDAYHLPGTLVESHETHVIKHGMWMNYKFGSPASSGALNRKRKGNRNRAQPVNENPSGNWWSQLGLSPSVTSPRDFAAAEGRGK